VCPAPTFREQILRFAQDDKDARARMTRVRERAQQPLSQGLHLARGARSLPRNRGRSLAPRERARSEGPGSRSRPHPAEPRAGAPQAQASRGALATCAPAPISGSSGFPRHPYFRSRREESPEVIEGGASRRGSERAARGQARGRGRIRPSREPVRRRRRSLAERSRRVGWEAGTRTPIHWSRASCPTIERPPSRSEGADYTG
jgi:hypothetical protein